MNTIGPKGWKPGDSLRRFADVTPSSYNSKMRTVEAVLRMGSPVTRFYGTEVLRIHPDAVDLARVRSGIAPLLDAHQQNGLDNHLGRIKEAWFAGKALMGQLAFDDTDRGRQAEGMVRRNEIAGISCGYSVSQWQITDSKGRELDPDVQRVSFTDDLTFTAVRWELHEASLVSVPADAGSMIRSLGSGQDRLPIATALDRIVVADIKRRMNARHIRMVRQNMINRARGIF